MNNNLHHFSDIRHCGTYLFFGAILCFNIPISIDNVPVRDTIILHCQLVIH